MVGKKDSGKVMYGYYGSNKIVFFCSMHKKKPTINIICGEKIFFEDLNLLGVSKADLPVRLSFAANS